MSLCCKQLKDFSLVSALCFPPVELTPLSDDFNLERCYPTAGTPRPVPLPGETNGNVCFPNVWKFSCMFGEQGSADGLELAKDTL